MQPYAILYRAFPTHRNDHAVCYTVDPHPVSDRGRQSDGWIIRAHFFRDGRQEPAVAYCRIVNGFAAFCCEAHTRPQPFHRGPDNPWADWPQWQSEHITEADWRHFAEHAPHYATQDVARLRRICQREKGRPHNWITETPEWRLVGWWPVVDLNGRLTGEVVEVVDVATGVSWYDMRRATNCVVLMPAHDYRNALEVAGLRRILGPDATITRHHDQIEMTLNGRTLWGNNPKHAIEQARDLREQAEAAAT